MNRDNIGYIICESYPDEPQQVEMTTKMINGKVVARGILQTADEKNRNGRYYSKEELFPQLTAPRTLELLNAGYLRAEMTHPSSKDLQRQATIDDRNTCARFLKLWTEGDNVWADFVATNNELGKSFNADLLEGCLPAWSLRALGSIEQTRRGAEVRNLRLITWDNVIYPSHPGAYTQSLVSESTSIVTTSNNMVVQEAMIIPYGDASVINFIEQDSKNIKFVKECFDFAYKEIQVSENGSKAILKTDEGDTMVINLESFVHNELMNYAVNRNKYTD